MSFSELQQLGLTIQGLESQRTLLGDAITDAALFLALVDSVLSLSFNIPPC
jgi:hypothetical protein